MAEREIALEKNGHISLMDVPLNGMWDHPETFGEQLEQNTLTVPVTKVRKIDLGRIFKDPMSKTFEEIYTSKRVVRAVGKFCSPESSVRVTRDNKGLNVILHKSPNGLA